MRACARGADRDREAPLSYIGGCRASRFGRRRTCGGFALCGCPKRICGRMDTDGNGTIEWDEFVDFMANPPPDAFKRPKNLKAAVAASQVRLVVPR